MGEGSGVLVVGHSRDVVVHGVGISLGAVVGWVLVVRTCLSGILLEL